MRSTPQSSGSASARRATVAAGALLALMQAGVASAQHETFFLPSGFSGRSGVQVISGPTRSGHPLCRPGLRGLDLARRALGADGCEAAPRGQRSLRDRIDTLILIDDTRGVSSTLSELIPARLRRGGRVVPGAVYGQTRDGRHVRRTLIVGAAEFRSAASEDAWMERVRTAARELDRGGTDRDEMEPQDIEVAYHRDYDEFQRAVEEALCPLMLCRSDGGARMRELIGRHQDLPNVHGGLSAAGEGRQVRIRAFLYRQRDRTDRIVDLRFDLAGEEVDMGDEGDEVVEGQRPSADPVVEGVEEDMVDSAGPRPPSARGDERYEVGLPYMAYLDGYGVTMSWLTSQSSGTPMDDQLLPTRRPLHPLGCGAPPLQARNRGGCEAALERWRGMDVAERRLLRIPENRRQMLDRLVDRYCEAFDHFCEGCACDRPQWAR